MNRVTLITLCERAIVPVNDWIDVETSESLRQIGELWAYLKAGLEYEVRDDSDADTIWVVVWTEGKEFEGDPHARSVHYLPTEKVLNKVNGKDWN